MGARVDFQLPDGSDVSAGPGSIVGRSFAADVHLDDGRVSEAHALVSLRGRELALLALRGRLRVDDRDVSRCILSPGLTVTLARGLALTVKHVELPRAVLAAVLTAPGGNEQPHQVLVGVTSVMRSPQAHLANGVLAGACALIFSDGLSWFVRVGDDVVRPVRNGSAVTVLDSVVRFVDVDLTTLEVLETVPGLLGDEPRLRVVTRFDSVELWSGEGERPLLVSGIAARLLSELLAFGGPVRWDMLCHALWRGADVDDDVLRHRLDVTLQKLRKRLVAAGIRRDLIVAHGTGQLELVLRPGDVSEDLS